MTALETAVSDVVTGARFTKRKSETVLELVECPPTPSSPSTPSPSNSCCASGSSTRRIGTDHSDKQRRCEHSKTLWTTPYVQGFSAKYKADVTTSASGAGSWVAQASLAVTDASIYQALAERRPCDLSPPAEDATLETEFDPLLVEEDALVQRIRELSSAPDVQRNELEGGPDQTLRHEERLRMARAGKRVHGRRHRPVATVLPNEIVIQVFEYLHDDQPTLLNVASVCLDWNLCATSILYRSPKFASTLHWALFIQTLCRSKESTRPRVRRRPSLIKSLSRSRQSSRHAPSQLAAAQIEVFGGRAQWSVSRLDYNLGEFVRHIDLSRKGGAVDTHCTCTKQSGAFNPQGDCPIHRETPPTGRVDSIHPANHIAVGTSQADQGTGLLVGDDASDSEADTSTRAVRTPMFSWRRDRFASPDEPSSSITTTVNVVGSGDRRTHDNSFAPSMTVRFDSVNGTNWLVVPPTDGDSLWRVRQSSQATYITRNSSSRTLAPSSIPLTPPSTISSQPGSTGPFQAVGTPGQASVDRTRSDTSTLYPSGPRSPLPGTFSSPERPAMVQRVETSDPRYKKPITITVSSLIQMAQYCPKLKLLCLGSTILTPDTLFLETGDYQSTLQPGPRAGLTFVPVAVADVAKALGQYCPHLRQLWLSGCEWVTLDELRVFLTHCLRLEVLDLRHCGKLDGRLSQLFVIKNSGGAPQEGRNAEHAGGEEGDEAFDKERRRARFLAMFRTGGACVGAPRQDVVEQMPLSNHEMHALPRVQTDPSPETTIARKGAMFDAVNAASSGRLGTLPGSGPPPWSQWSRAEEQEQQEQQEHDQPLCYRYRLTDDRGYGGLVQEQGQQEQQQQHAVRSAMAPDSTNRYQLVDDLCALELLQSLDRPRSEVEAPCDNEQAHQGQGYSEISNGTDHVNDNDDDVDQEGDRS
ncbi:hypothetical protein BGZ70_002852 [Mortierella alpina]|uniref:F-box domain-containing protein n=1 Tax=Mortierella alpina TaxID=64518 RepID=A0A9P6ITT3_MORAP|nr:hypothetical protein BGZ70_002852 [Mortierella alpina]